MQMKAWKYLWVSNLENITQDRLTVFLSLNDTGELM